MPKENSEISLGRKPKMKKEVSESSEISLGRKPRMKRKEVSEMSLGKKPKMKKEVSESSEISLGRKPRMKRKEVSEMSLGRRPRIKRSESVRVMKKENKKIIRTTSAKSFKKEDWNVVPKNKFDKLFSKNKKILRYRIRYSFRDKKGKKWDIDPCMLLGYDDGKLMIMSKGRNITIGKDKIIKLEVDRSHMQTIKKEWEDNKGKLAKRLRLKIKRLQARLELLEGSSDSEPRVRRKRKI